jgi:hypothetical protein
MGIIVGVCIYSVHAVAEQLPNEFIGSWKEMGNMADKLQEPCSKNDHDLEVITSNGEEKCKITSIKRGAPRLGDLVSVNELCDGRFGKFRMTKLWTIFEIGKEQYRITIVTDFPDRLGGKSTGGKLSGYLSKRCR